jgi:hypothetical protein
MLTNSNSPAAPNVAADGLIPRAVAIDQILSTIVR